MALTLVVLAGCGDGGSPSPRLVDGARQPALPRALSTLEHGVMTRIQIRTAAGMDAKRLRDCEGWVGARASPSTLVAERTGIVGESLTFRDGSHVYGCDGIADPAQDPDRDPDDPWCRGAVGRLENGALIDPRLALCTGQSGDIVAFAWVEPRSPTKWVVVRDAGSAEVYDAVGELPVRISSSGDVDPEGSATFDVEEYGSDGSELRSYRLEAGVAG